VPHALFRREPTTRCLRARARTCERAPLLTPPTPPISVSFYHETGCGTELVCDNCAVNTKTVEEWESGLEYEQSTLEHMRETLPQFPLESQPDDMGKISKQERKVEACTAAVARSRAAVPVSPPGVRGECPNCAHDFGVVPGH
jgi:hypothetical protein